MYNRQKGGDGIMENTGSFAISTEVKSKFKYDHLVYILLGFFMGQADLAAGLYPFSLVYWSLFVGYDNLLFFFVSLSIAAGLLFTGDLSNLSYCGGIIGLLFFKLFERKYEKRIWLMALLISFSFLITSFSFNYFREVLLYEYLLKTGESILIFLLIMITKKGIKDLSFTKKSLTDLEKVVVLLISAGLLIGLNFIPYYGVIINILILLIIVGATYANGINLGIFLAVIYGLIFVSCGIIPMVTMIKYIIYALVCALFVHKKKIWILAALLLSFLLYSGFAPSLYNIKITLLETGVVLCVFLLIPPFIWDYFFKRFAIAKPVVRGSEINRRYEQDFKQQLAELADVFTELSFTFEEVLPGEKKEKENRVNDFIYLFKNKNCKNCPRKRKCWFQNKEKTLEIIKNLLTAGLKKGKIDKKICEQYLGEICIYSKAILPGVKSSFELFQINNFWRNRLVEKQKTVSAQLAGMGNIVKEFSHNTSLAANYKISLHKIKNNLLKNNIDVYDICINSETRYGRVNILLKVEPCQGNRPCLNKILHILNSEFDYDFRLLNSKCGNILKERPCHLHYGPVGEYEIELFSLQKAVRKDISGDTLLHKKMKNGKDLIILCDGMGVGSKAAGESKRAVNLFKNIMEAGFNQKLAIKIINSALFLRNQEERFTTMDIAFFDTFTGKLEMEKIGAMTTFIKRGWDIITLRSSSLPAGIMESIETTSYTEKLKENDFVFMLSDGLLDAVPGMNDREEWFTQLLKKISFDEPREYTEYIMEVIENRARIKDDMSIIIFKIKGRK